MERLEAIEKLKLLTGKSLQELANEHDITIINQNGRVNKGWAGHAIERYLELPLNSAQAPNFGSWELKTIPLQYRNGRLTIKETMAITMIDPINICQKEFENSHLLSKLKKAVIVTRIVGQTYQDSSVVHDIIEVNINEDTELYQIIKADYNLVREALLNNNKNLNCLSGRMGQYIQPRTKGSGHGSNSRAFYARKILLQQLINQNQS
ncbi:MutH/Sau3AI family endonuclease [Pelistega sp. MC2]|uniref:MutH/Sau3AI family endonuclease n=1 Tax=Pelistega sp. MC2 TaxID=1720297 RepID=UPI0009F649B9|nr:MutH/Sau3AI family endonuclease [Pelistega sp. MC2]